MATPRSYRNKSGRIVHTDGKGNVTGVSYTSPSGGKVTHYDAAGNKTGVSYTSLSGGTVTHYDASGSKTGRTYVNSHGGMTHYDAQGNKTGKTFMNQYGGMTHFSPVGGNGSPSGGHRAQTQESARSEQLARWGCLLLAVVILMLLTAGCTVLYCWIQ